MKLTVTQEEMQQMQVYEKWTNFIYLYLIFLQVDDIEMTSDSNAIHVSSFIVSVQLLE